MVLVRREGKRPEAFRTAKPDFSDLVVVCAKCAKRQGIAKREAGRSLKRTLKEVDPKRKVKVIRSGCLGPCPKRHIAVATAASLSEKRVILLDPGLSPEALARILPDFGLKA